MHPYSRFPIARSLVVLAGLSCLLAACASISEQEVQLAYSHRQLAEVKFDQGELEMAIREFRQSVELNPEDPEAHFGLGEAYRYKGLLPDSERHFLEAIRLRPDHADAKLNLGVVYLMQQRWVEAIAVFQGLADDPTFIRPARALVNLGWAQYKSGDLVAARGSLELAVSAERSNYIGYLDLGIVLYDQGELVESIRQFDAALGLLDERAGPRGESAAAEARFRKAQAYVKLGLREEAIEQLEIAVARNRETEWGRRSQEYLKILR